MTKTWPHTDQWIRCTAVAADCCTI